MKPHADTTSSSQGGAMPADLDHWIAVADECVAMLAEHPDVVGDTSIAALMPELGRRGLIGTMVPVEYGGEGLSLLHNCVIQERIASVAPSLAALRAVTGVFVTAPLLEYGSEEQKRTWLPRFSSGESTTALGLTEPNAGSDAGSIETIAVREADGSYRLRGEKHFISGAAEADVILVYCVTNPEAGIAERLSAFLVPTAAEGVHASEEIDTLGVHGLSHCRVKFDGVTLTEADRVGADGQGNEVMMFGLVPERVDIASRAVGCARAAFAEAVKYARERHQFKQPIRKFQAVSHKIADMRTDLEAAHLLTLEAARMFDSGVDAQASSAMAKLYAANKGFEICDNALQILGARGYSREMCRVVEQMFRDIRVLRLGGGTDEIMRHVIQREVFFANA